MNTILTVVLPVFALIAAGYLAGSRGLLGGGAPSAIPVGSRYPEAKDGKF